MNVTSARLCLLLYWYFWRFSQPVQSLSLIWFFATPWTVAGQASLSFIISQDLLKLMSIESMMPSNHLVFCCPILLLTLIFPSIWVFSNELAFHIMWPKYWNFSISPLINVQDWFPLGLTGLISSESKGLSRVSPNTTVQKHQILGTQPSLWLVDSH